MSELEQKLLDAIRAAPDDDAPRLVYADWRAERGDEARAELVRLQLQRARLPAWEAEQVRLDLRERALLEANGMRWRRAELPLLDRARWGRFARGFVGRVAFDDLDALKAYAEACLAATVLHSVAVPWGTRAEWVDVPRLPGLRELTLYGELLSDGDVDGLVESGLLDGVRALNLVESQIEDAALERLLASPHLGRLEALRLPHHLLTSVGPLVRASLPSLVELDLSSPTFDEFGSGGPDGSGLDDVAMVELAGWAGLARVRSLDVSGNVVGADGLRALLSSPYAAGLRELRIRAVVEEGERMPLRVLRAATAPELETLTLQGELDVAGAEQLGQASCLGSLRALELHYVREVEAGAMQALTRAPWFERLQVLDCTGGGSGLDLLQGVIERGRLLHTLRIAHGYSWGARGLEMVEQLGHSPASNRLLTLDLSHDGLGDRVAARLAEATGLANLQALLVRDHFGFDPASQERFVASPLGRRLVSLELASPSHLDRLPRPIPEALERGMYTGPLSEL